MFASYMVARVLYHLEGFTRASSNCAIALLWRVLCSLCLKSVCMFVKRFCVVVFNRLYISYDRLSVSFIRFCQVVIIRFATKSRADIGFRRLFVFCLACSLHKACSTHIKAPNVHHSLRGTCYPF